MNDFTKDELEYIADCVDFGIFDSERNDNFLYLDKKIQTMIDSYCEHPESEANLNYEVEKCKECGALFV